MRQQRKPIPLSIIPHHKTISFPKKDSTDIMNTTGDQSPDTAKDGSWAHRPLLTEGSLQPKSLKTNKVKVKSNNIDLQGLSHSMIALKPIIGVPLHRKESAGVPSKELSSSLLNKVTESPGQVSTMSTEGDSALSKRPITVTLGGLKAKSEAKGKTPKSGSEPNNNPQGTKKKVIREDTEESTENPIKIAYSLTPVSRLGSSGTYKVKPDSIFIDLRDKNSTPVGGGDEKPIDKTPINHSKTFYPSTSFDKGFRMRVLPNSENPMLSITGSQKLRSKDSNIYIQKMEDSMFKGAPLTGKTDPGLEEFGSLVKDDDRIKEKRQGVYSDSRQKVISKSPTIFVSDDKASLFDVGSLSLTTSPKTKPKLDRMATTNYGSLPKIVSLKFDPDIPQVGDIGSYSKDDEDSIGRDSEVRAVKAKNSRTAHRERNESRLLSRQSKHPALETLLMQAKQEFAKTEQSWEDEKEKTRDMEEEVEKYSRPTTQSMKETLTRWNKGAEGNGKAPGHARRQVISLSLGIKAAAAAIEEEGDQSQELCGSTKNSLQGSKEGANVSYYPRKESQSGHNVIVWDKNGRRVKGGIEDMRCTTVAFKEEPKNLLERKLINQLGRRDTLEGWDLDTSGSEADAPIVFSPSPWKNSKKGITSTIN